MVVKESSLTRRLQSAVSALQRDIVVPAGLFRGRDAAGCPRRGLFDARKPISHDPEKDKWMSLLEGIEFLEVVRRRVELSDVESNFIPISIWSSGLQGEMLLVLIRRHELPESPLNGDICDMTASMYLSGIHSGLIVYFYEEKFVSFFVNPDKKTYKELLEVVVSGGRRLYACELRGVVPAGNSGELCTSCPYGKNCDDSAVAAHGGQSGSRKDDGGSGSEAEDEDEDRPEAGEPAGSHVWEETGNTYLFQQIYEPRIPTIVYLGRRFAWLVEDVESEINVVFVRSIEKFSRSGRDFNTFFYTNVLNHMRNLLKSKKRQKRTMIDGSDPSMSTVRLDDEIDEDRRYHEIVPSTSDVLSNVSVSEMIECVREESWVLYDIMLEIASNGSPCIKRRAYKNSVEVLENESEASAISRHVGLPSNLYNIEVSSRSGNLLSYEISVSGQKTVHYLSSYLKNKGFAG